MFSSEKLTNLSLQNLDNLVNATIPRDIQAANAMKNLWLIQKIKAFEKEYLNNT